MKSNDSRLINVEEETDQDLFEEDDPNEEDETEVPSAVDTLHRGEDLLFQFKLKGPEAENVCTDFISKYYFTDVDC